MLYIYIYIYMYIHMMYKCVYIIFILIYDNNHSNNDDDTTRSVRVPTRISLRVPTCLTGFPFHMSASQVSV